MKEKPMYEKYIKDINTEKIKSESFVQLYWGTNGISAKLVYRPGYNDEMEDSTVFYQSEKIKPEKYYGKLKWAMHLAEYVAGKYNIWFRLTHEDNRDFNIMSWELLGID